MRRPKNIFILYLLAVFLAAGISSPFGADLSKHSWIQTSLIMLMYFSMGISNEFSLLIKGITDIKLHIVSQASMFILAPLVSFLLFKAATSFFQMDTSIGIIFLGCLPTTITSCVILTKHSGGNEIGSIYNAMLSQILSVFITPLLLSLLLRSRVEELSSVWSVVYSLTQKMLFPLIAGQIVRLIFGQTILPIRKVIDKVSFYAIFVILYLNVSAVIQDGSFGSFKTIALSAVFACILFFSLQSINLVLGRIFRLSVPNRISVAYTGTQKTLGMGIPLAGIIFAGDSLMISHVTTVIISYYVCSMFLSVLIVDTYISRDSRNKELA